jgi:hypothetical protein
MPKYIIEREFPASMSEEDLWRAARSSLKVLKKMKGKIQWVESFVTEKKTYSIYIAPSEADIRTHAKQAGLPCNQIARIKAIIDPSTAEPG